jgi:hypothetical protein
MRKKILSLALALAMCLGLMAVPAAAVNPGEEWVGDFVVKGDTLVKYYGEDSVITVPGGVTKIGTNAFEDCVSLKSVTIPNGVTEIESYSFKDCTGLTSVTIPNSVTSIGYSVFSRCTSLTNVTIPNSVTQMGSSVFLGCTSLENVSISNSITKLEGGLFYGCTSLTNVTIPSSVREIDWEIFYGCTALTNVTIPSSVTSIGKSAFSGCTSLKSVVIPSGVTRIEDFTFSKSGLTSVTIPSGVTEIGSYAFGDCTSLTSMTIPLSVTFIDSWAFMGCTGLTDIYYAGTKAQWKANVGEQALNYAQINPTVHFNSTGPSTPSQPQQPAGEAASPTNDKLEVNGAAANPTVYKIGGSNYFKIRDVAALLNGTEKQFAVGYDGSKNAVTATTGQGYDKQSGDLAGAATGGGQSADPSNDAIYVDGQKITAEVYKINGSNYFKLRDLGKALNFYVGWSAERGMYIETGKPYSE